MSSGIGETLTLLMSIANKAMDMLPNYEQRKKEEFHKLRKRYEEEVAKKPGFRDDNLVGIYRMDLLRFISVFKGELDGENEN